MHTKNVTISYKQVASKAVDRKVVLTSVFPTSNTMISRVTCWSKYRSRRTNRNQITQNQFKFKVRA